MRNPVQKKEEAPPVPEPTEQQETPVQIVEREITLSVINEKLNYAIGLLHKIGEACEIDKEK